MEQSIDTHNGNYTESSFGADNSTDVLQEVKNTMYEGSQETGVYSKLAPK